MELNEALGRISQIHEQVGRTRTFRGFRSLTVGFSGVLGIAAALVQANRITHPVDRVGGYVSLWVSVALISLVVVGAELVYRWSVTDSSFRRRQTILVIRQFAPCLVAGATLTAIVVLSAREIAWTLPGLWAILFSLGVFACSGLMPPAMFWVGVYYLASGAASLAIGSGSQAFSPWMMAGTFGIGQLLTAGILYYCLERNSDELKT